MSRLSTALSTAVSSELVRPFFLCEIHFGTLASDILRLSTLNYQVTYDSEVYEPAASLLTISAVDENTDLGASGIRISLSGADANIVQKTRDKDYQGLDCNVYLGAVTANQQIIDVVPYFFGLNDHITFTQKERSVDISLTAENMLIRFGKSNIKRYTDADQKALHSTDLGFSLVNSIQEKEIKWGT